MFPFSIFICDDSVGSCEASFLLKAVVHIYAKSTRYSGIIKGTAELEFDTRFSSLSFKFFACKLKLAPLKRCVKLEPAKPDALAG